MTVDEFRELLRERGASLPDACPSCGATEWGALDEELVLPIRRSSPVGRYGGGSDPSQVIVVTPTCTRCGWMVFYDRAVLSGEFSIQPGS